MTAPAVAVMRKSRLRECVRGRVSVDQQRERRTLMGLRFFARVTHGAGTPGPLTGNWRDFRHDLAGVQSDLFAVGTMLWEMAVGQRAWRNQ